MTARFGYGTPQCSLALDPEQVTRFDVRAQLKGLKMPVLVLAGRFDRNVPPKLATRYREYLPHAEFVMFEKSGHFTFFEETDTTVEALRMFLKR
ncbi:MAG TPA: alpha/beta hydrolase [Gemmatimonadaceae bacterium]|nr:alpha/beta hydrolase [Gemmatimonadaceae bacterium]